MSKQVYIDGAGWNLFYYIGITRYLKTHIDISDWCFKGVSAGAWIGVLLISDVSSHDVYEYWKDRSLYQRKKTTFLDQIYSGETMRGMFALFKLKSEQIQDINDRSRLSIYIKTISKSLCVDLYKNHEMLLEALMATAFVPMITKRSLYYKFNNQICFDGVFTRKKFDNFDLCLSIKQITDQCDNLCFNKKTQSSFYPPSSEYCDYLYENGYEDASRYFKKYQLDRH